MQILNRIYRATMSQRSGVHGYFPVLSRVIILQEVSLPSRWGDVIKRWERLAGVDKLNERVTLDLLLVVLALFGKTVIEVADYPVTPFPLGPVH